MRRYLICDHKFDALFFILNSMHRDAPCTQEHNAQPQTPWQKRHVACLRLCMWRDRSQLLFIATVNTAQCTTLVAHGQMY